MENVDECITEKNSLFPLAPGSIALQVINSTAEAGFVFLSIRSLEKGKKVKGFLRDLFFWAKNNTNVDYQYLRQAWQDFFSMLISYA